jgi:hypothetical protein
MELLAVLRSLTLGYLVVVLGACIGTSPEQAEADALGPDPSGEPDGPLHRAGFPCTRCHGDAWWQESPTFRLAGTIYEASSGTRGFNNAEVVVRDAAGRELVARTNRTGNFFFVEEGSTASQRAEGRFQIPSDFTFPLRVSVRSGNREQTMRGLIWRERSCSACHRDGPDEDNNGQIFVTEPNP